MTVIIISNNSEIECGPNEEKIFFNPWGFSREAIRADFQSVLHQIELGNNSEIRLLMKPYLFGNRMKFLETVLRDNFPNKKIYLELV